MTIVRYQRYAPLPSPNVTFHSEVFSTNAEAVNRTNALLRDGSVVNTITICNAKGNAILRLSTQRRNIGAYT